jgi:hypothetical protein
MRTTPLYSEMDSTEHIEESLEVWRVIQGYEGYEEPRTEMRKSQGAKQKKLKEHCH